ncbi:sterol-binding domain-containing protein [Jannaschia pagri]|uniref:Sterol-binding domain-containing protein n=1 Tax=Jannaschia pagri TaxID=2829797 RepID=A0ABQ4NGG3_9RHOB|nr:MULTISPECIES: SCP2 sterol-binding domain-containing protein [unclassified Jannaschia]GIT90380.1 sterol-binding domain-containing protein [Jannaschia sp. AI_61]GIT93514.1 sterol-binding domain-containing protein [Jannaschia sp. AI_62]
MSDIISEAVTQLSAKIGSFDSSVKFVIEDEGAIMIDSDGVRAADEEAECTMTADAETFKGILDGDVNPTGAFMSGKLTVDGDMGVAMKLGGALS